MSIIKVQLDTNGQGVKFEDSRLWVHPDMGTDMAYAVLKIGDVELTVRFRSFAELLEFCEKHNFPITDDERGKDNKAA